MAIIPQSNPMGQENQPKRQGSGFTNLSRILQANRQNRLGQAISSGITGGTEQVRQQLGDTRGQFQQASEAGRLGTDQDKALREGVLQGIAGGQTDISKQQEEAFQKFRSGQYKGPKELDQAKVISLGGRAQELQQQAKNPLSENTLQSIIGTQSRQPYSRGQIGLDRTLLGTVSPEVLGQARGAARGLPESIRKEQEGARALGSLRSGEAQQFKADTLGQLGTQQTGLQSNITNEVGKQQGLLDAEMQKYKADPYAYLNTSRAQTYGLDLPSYGGLVNFANKGDINTSSVANQQQLAQLQALAKLSGGQQEFITDPSKVGSFAGQNLASIDQNLLDRAVAGQKTKFSEDLAPVLANLKDYALGGIDPKRANELTRAAYDIANRYGQNANAPTDEFTGMWYRGQANPWDGMTGRVGSYADYIQSLLNKPTTQSKTTAAIKSPGTRTLV